LRASNSQNDKGIGDKINFDKNLVNICVNVNVNVNEQVKVTPPPEEEPSACENCFSDLTQTQKDELLSIVDAISIGAIVIVFLILQIVVMKLIVYSLH
jgi:hypothetical protein